MKKIIFLFLITVISIVVMITMKLINNNEILSYSDTSKVKYTVNIGVDNWAGYFYLCSKEMRKESLKNEILVNCIDDGADFDSRFLSLKNGETQMAVFTADSFIKNGEKYNYPAKIVTVIDESKGGDAIFINKKKASKVSEIKNSTNLRVSYTKDSPSELLLTTWKNDFGVNINDKEKFQIKESTGSKNAYEMLINENVDMAVVWQPEVSKIESDSRFIKIMGSDQIKNVIVDVLVVENNFMLNNKDVLEKFMISYYKTMNYYKVNEEEFNKELSYKTGIMVESQLTGLKDGIQWQDISSVAINWLGIDFDTQNSYIQLFDTLNMVTKIMLNDNQLSNNPIPNGDAFSLINSKIIESVVSKSLKNEIDLMVSIPNNIEDVSLTRKFSKISPAKWNMLRKEKVLGAINIPEITFVTGTSDLYPNYEEQKAFDMIKDIMLKYPRSRIIVEGHTGRGDAIANMDLSKKRSNKVQELILDNMGVDKNRLMTIGYGATQPPERNQNENKISWWKRWARVNIVVVQE